MAADVEIAKLTVQVESLSGSISRLENAIENLTKNNGKQDHTIMALEAKLERLTDIVEKHITWHDEDRKLKSGRTWQIIAIVITLLLTNVASVLIGLLK